VSAKTVVKGIKPGAGVGVLLLPGVALGVGVAALRAGRTETAKSEARKKEKRTRNFLDASAGMRKS
jgi:hypothetical protein